MCIHVYIDFWGAEIVVFMAVYIVPLYIASFCLYNKLLFTHFQFVTDMNIFSRVSIHPLKPEIIPLRPQIYSLEIP